MITSPSRAQVRVQEVDHRSRPLRRQAVDPRVDRVEDLPCVPICSLTAGEGVYLVVMMDAEQPFSEQENHGRDRVEKRQCVEECLQ